MNTPNFTDTTFDWDEDANIVSVRRKHTGIPNTIFISTQGHGRRAAGIKVASDLPDSLNAASSTASMLIHDYQVIGATMPPRLVEQLKQWIDLSRDASMACWNKEIETGGIVGTSALEDVWPSLLKTDQTRRVVLSALIYGSVNRDVVHRPTTEGHYHFQNTRHQLCGSECV
jgi:hypothetical protein